MDTKHKALEKVSLLNDGQKNAKNNQMLLPGQERMFNQLCQ